VDNTHVCIKIRCLRNDQRKALYILSRKTVALCAFHVPLLHCGSFSFRPLLKNGTKLPYQKSFWGREHIRSNSPFSLLFVFLSFISVQFTVNGRMIENNFDVHEITFARNCWLIKPSHPWARKSHLGQKHSWDKLRSILFAKKRVNIRQWQKLTRRTNFIYILECRHIFHWIVVLEAVILIFGSISFDGGGRES